MLTLIINLKRDRVKLVESHSQTVQKNGNNCLVSAQVDLIMFRYDTAFNILMFIDM